MVSRAMASASPSGGEPPQLFRLAAHTVRWRLLRQLARSDLRVSELCDLVEERQSLVSYHLRSLRDSGLVFSRRSTGDGRDIYHALDLARCRELLLESGSTLHPGVVSGFTPATPPARESVSACVLFACTGNSVRSPVAEALAVQLSAGAVEAVSAGSAPRPLDPVVARVMRSRGIDLSGRRPRHLSEFTHRPFDYVVTVCDRVREVCPEFPGKPEKIHWSVPPPHDARDERRAVESIERTVAELRQRVDFLVASIAGRPSAGRR